MTQSKHTPGEWVASGIRTSALINGAECKVIGFGPDGAHIGFIAYSDREPGDHTRSIADLRVCAAAPGLLEAARLGRIYARVHLTHCELEGDGPAISEVQGDLSIFDAAIAKATGKEA